MNRRQFIKRAVGAIAGLSIFGRQVLRGATETPVLPYPHNGHYYPADVIKRDARAFMSKQQTGDSAVIEIAESTL
jgi:hypothetical protein